MKTKIGAILVMLLLVALQTPGWGAPNKSALVIGNGAYQDIPLRNPVNDAQAMAAALEKLGFRVTQKTNVTQPDMENAIREFGQTLKKEDVALFYFSGHGVQVNGINYLLPIGADIRSEDEVKYKAVDAGMVLDKLEAAGNQLNIVILDACRNNPYKGARSMSRGLAVMSAPPGALIAYATAPGTTAADGEGDNSPYTKHLLAAMNAPGLKIEEVFKKVRVGVMADTANQQVPWEASSLTGDFYFLAKKEEQKLETEEKHEADNQLWRFTHDEGDYYQIIAKHSGKCLDVTGISLTNGTNVWQWDCLKAQQNQWWNLVYISNDTGYDYYQIIAKHSGKCLDAYSNPPSNGANVYQWGCHGHPNQLWRLVPVGDYYQIINKYNARCLAVEKSSPSNEAKIILWDCSKVSTTQTKGIILYQEAFYRGKGEKFTKDNPNLSDSLIGNDANGSIRIPRGCKATLYEHANYGGKSETFTADVPWLEEHPIGYHTVTAIKVTCSGK